METHHPLIKISVYFILLLIFLLNNSLLSSAEAKSQTPSYQLLSNKELNARNQKFDATLRNDPNAIRKQAASLNIDALHAVRSHQSNQITFPLFDGKTITGTVEHRFIHSKNRYTLIGKFDDDLSEFVVSVYNSVTMMDIQSPNIGQYKLRYQSKDLYELRKQKIPTEPFCQVGEQVGLNKFEKENITPSTYQKIPSLHKQSDDGSVIDVMAVYTDEAEMDAGGEDAIRANIDAAFSIANAAFERSGIETQLRLVFVRKVNYTQHPTEILTDLERLRKTNDEYLVDVHYWRDRVGADLVCMFLGGQVGGWAYINNPSWWPDMSIVAFSVVQFDAGQVFAHEIGHNFGCHHAVGDLGLSQGGGGRFYYSHGSRITGDNGQVYHSIMTYPPGVRVGNFSSPLIERQGQPMGDPVFSDNARGMNNVLPYIASFRTSTVALEISPITPNISIGSTGGKFVPEKFQYEVVNAASNPIEFSILKSADWLSIDFTTATVQANSTLVFDVTINQAIAMGLSEGTHVDTLVLRNETQNIPHDLTIQLNVLQPQLADIFAGSLDVLDSSYREYSGPVWHPEKRLLIFNKEGSGQRMIWENKQFPTGKVTPIFETTNRFINNTLDRNNVLLSSQRISSDYSMTFTTDLFSLPEVMELTYNNMPLISGRDMVVPSSGNIYFIDPGNSSGDQSFPACFMIDTKNNYELILLDSTLRDPVALAFSPDESKLYICDVNPQIFVFDVMDSGTLSNKRLFVEISGNFFNDIKVDETGRLFVCTDTGVEVIDNQGVSLGTLPMLQGYIAKGCAFGDFDRRSLFITTGAQGYRVGNLLRVRVRTPGIAAGDWSYFDIDRNTRIQDTWNIYR